jgi:hypothetical protein
MKRKTVVLGIVVMVMFKLISTVYASESTNSPTNSFDSFSTTNNRTFYWYLGLGQYEFLPMGELPQQFFARAPREWKIQGWDITLGLSGKKMLGGPVYLGGGLGTLLGWGHDDYKGNSTWIDESYGRFGFDGNLDFGVRLPIGKKEHLDIGAKLGGYVDLGGGHISSFSYSHAILWYGPGIALEPNAGSPGLIAGTTLRLPLCGHFAMDNMSVGTNFYDVKSKSVLRFELGYKFNNGFTIIGYGEKGGFEFEDDFANTFDQKSSTVGIALRFYN